MQLNGSADSGLISINIRALGAELRVERQNSKAAELESTAMSLLGSMIFVCLAGAAAAQTGADAIDVTGAVKYPVKLSAADLMELPRASVEMTRDGRKVRYEGVWLHEVLKKAGAAGGTALRGQSLASYLLVESADKYQVVFSLAEIDPVFTDAPVLLADRADGKPLDAKEGPFRIVAPKEKRAARSARMVTKLEVVQLWK